MKALRFAALTWMSLAPLAAGTVVNVSANTTQQMNTGDTLYFLVSNLSLPRNIDSVQFLFATLPLDNSALFAADLMARDGSAWMAFSWVDAIPGTFSGAGYRGPVTVLTGELALSPGASATIFQNTRATLALRNIGPAVTFNLPGYTLSQAMGVVLSRDNYRVGAVTAGALYEAAGGPGSPGGAGASLDAVQAPEIGSGALLGGAGILLCVFSRMLNRISHRRIQ